MRSMESWERFQYVFNEILRGAACFGQHLGRHVGRPSLLGGTLRKPENLQITMKV